VQRSRIGEESQSRKRPGDAASGIRRTHRDDEVKQMRALCAHVARPVAKLALTTAAVAVAAAVRAAVDAAAERVDARRRGRPPPDDGDKKLRPLGLDAGRVKALRVPQLSINVDGMASAVLAAPSPGLAHEEDGELARELDQPVVARLSDDEDALDVGPDARPACWAGRASERGGQTAGE
jgi:hypothetical protein